MDNKIKNEIVGRLWLWSESISKTKYLLEMAFRTNIGKQDEFRLHEQETYINKLNEFAKQQPDYRPGVIFPSHRKIFDELYPRAFPTWLECCAIHDAFVELAIVYFCQVFNRGDSQNGEAAENGKKIREDHLEKILAEIFPTPNEMTNFDLLKSSILKVRNKVIGHSDADSYSITHDPISIMKGPNITWRDIDFEFWYFFLEKMITAIRNYSNLLKSRS